MNIEIEYDKDYNLSAPCPFDKGCMVGSTSCLMCNDGGGKESPGVIRCYGDENQKRGFIE